MPSRAVEQLRLNDPELTEILVILREETSDEELAEALEQNEYVTKVTLKLERMRRDANFARFLRVLATRATLRVVDFEGAGVPWREGVRRR